MTQASATAVTDILPVILPLVWAAILALAVFLYVVLGGYDLGLGALFPIAPSDKDRDAMMGSVSPFWDGNETWLVMGGGGLLAAFPLAYAVMLPALYIPIILMLIGLILRGVAFEFRFKSERSRWMWDTAFAGGSLLAALMQGAIIGAFVHGFAVTDNKFSGGAFDWVTPFSVVTAVAVLSGYVLLIGGLADHEGRRGVTRMGLWHRPLRADRGRRVHRHLQPVDSGPASRDRHALVHACSYRHAEPRAAHHRGGDRGLWITLDRRYRYMPFLLAVAIFILCYTGLAVSLFPFIIPPDITIWQAAAAPESQLFMLYGAIPIIPIILAYTAYSYYVFWDATEHDAYH